MRVFIVISIFQVRFLFTVNSVAYVVFLCFVVNTYILSIYLLLEICYMCVFVPRCSECGHFWEIRIYVIL